MGGDEGDVTLSRQNHLKAHAYAPAHIPHHVGPTLEQHEHAHVRSHTYVDRHDHHAPGLYQVNQIVPK
jgi:hypothetical protein